MKRNDFSVAYFAGSFMFLFTMFLMGGPTKDNKSNPEIGHDNTTFTDEDGRAATLELPRLPARPHNYDNSRL